MFNGTPTQKLSGYNSAITDDRDHYLILILFQKPPQSEECISSTNDILMHIFYTHSCQVWGMYC